MADKGDHPGIHIDPTDFYKDAKQDINNKNQQASDKDKNLGSQTQSTMNANKNMVKDNMQEQKSDANKDKNKGM